MIEFITAIRNTDRYIESIYQEGGCYQFYLLLKHLFPESQPMMHSAGNHVATLYKLKLYDISGEVLDGDFHPLTEEERHTVKEWTFHNNMALEITECPACGEPICI